MTYIRFTYAFMLFSALVLYSNSVRAADAQKYETDETGKYFVTKLDTVTVVATKKAQPTFSAPAMVGVISSAGDDASSVGSGTLTDIFATTPSVQMTGTARRNGQAPSLRGASQNSVLVTVDGVRQNFQSRHDGRFFIDPAMIQQTEIVRGPASMLYGSGAIGGVVAFETLKADTFLEPGQKSGSEVSAGFESVNNNMTENFKTAVRKGDFDIFAGISKADSGNINLGGGGELKSDDDLLSGLVNANWYANDLETVSFGYSGYRLKASESNNPQLGAAEDMGQDYADKTTQNHSSHIKYNNNNPDAAVFNNFTATAYYSLTMVDEKVAVDTLLNDVGDELQRHLNTLGFNLDNQTYLSPKNAGKHTLSYGLEYYNDRQNGRDTGDATGENGGVPDAVSDTYAAYLQNEITFDNLKIPGEVTFIPGIRFDSYSSSDEAGNSQNDRKVSPKLSTSYKPNKNLMFFGSYAEGFRAPNLTELYSSGTHFSIPMMGTNDFVPNPDLKPESSATFEAGAGVEFPDIVTNGDKFRVKGSKFWTRADDFIDLDVNLVFFPGCCGTSTNVNIPNAELHGIDLETGYDSQDWGITVAYSEVTGRNTDTGEYLTSIIPPTLSVNPEYRFDEIGLKTGIISRFAAEHNEVNAATDKRNGYGTHDVYVNWKPVEMPSITLKAGIENMFDKKYEKVFAGSPEAGRNFKVGASWRF